MEGGLQGAPSKISIFLEGIYFGGPWTNPKSKKIGKIFFEPLLLHKKEHFFVLGWWNIFLRVILDLANVAWYILMDQNQFLSVSVTMLHVDTTWIFTNNIFYMSAFGYLIHNYSGRMCAML